MEESASRDPPPLSPADVFGAHEATGDSNDAFAQLARDIDQAETTEEQKQDREELPVKTAEVPLVSDDPSEPPVAQESGEEHTTIEPEYSIQKEPVAAQPAVLPQEMPLAETEEIDSKSKDLGHDSESSAVPQSEPAVAQPQTTLNTSVEDSSASPSDLANEQQETHPILEADGKEHGTNISPHADVIKMLEKQEAASVPTQGSQENVEANGSSSIVSLEPKIPAASEGETQPHESLQEPVSSSLFTEDASPSPFDSISLQNDIETSEPQPRHEAGQSREEEQVLNSDHSAPELFEQESEPSVFDTIASEVWSAPPVQEDTSPANPKENVPTPTLLDQGTGSSPSNHLKSQPSAEPGATHVALKTGTPEADGVFNAQPAPAAELFEDEPETSLFDQISPQEDTSPSMTGKVKEPAASGLLEDQEESSLFDQIMPEEHQNASGLHAEKEEKGASSLFGDEAGASPFDDLITQEEPGSTVEFTGVGESGALFGDDQSDRFPPSQDLPELTQDQGTESTQTQSTNDDQEVPLGWYDDYGEFQWYTEEEREQVRLSMYGPAQTVEARKQASQDILNAGFGSSMSPALPRSPAVQTESFLSENALRRTPQPQAVSEFDSSMYAPPATASSYAPSNTAQSTYTPSYTDSLSYVPALGSPAATNTYNPYAPSKDPLPAPTKAPIAAPPSAASRNSTYNAYDPPMAFKPPPVQARPSFTAPSSYAPSPVQTYAPAPPPPAKSEPPQPRPQPLPRTASNAFDPPLKPVSKAIPRPASAVNAGASPYGFAPMAAPQEASQMPPMPPAGPPRGVSRPSSRGPAFALPPSQHQATSAPPTGQPRRPASTSRPPSRGPAFAPPPSFQAPPVPEIPSSLKRTSVESQRDEYTSLLHAEGLRSPPIQMTGLMSPPRAHQAPAPPRKTTGISSPPQNDQAMTFPPYDTGLASPPQSHIPSGPPGWTPAENSGPSSRGPAYAQPPAVSSHEPSPYSPTQQLDVYARGTSATQALQQSLPRSTQFDQPTLAQHQQRGSFDDPYAPQHHIDELYEQYGSQGQQYGGRREEQQEPTGKRPDKQYSAYVPYVSHQAPVKIERLGQASSPEPSPYDSPYAPATLPPHQATAPSSRYAPPPSSAPAPAPARHYTAPYGAYDSDPYAAPPPSTAQKISPYDPAPPATFNRAASPAHSSVYGASPPSANYFQSMPAPQRSESVDTSYIPQQVLEQRPISEDPLGRTTLAARNAPIAIFGFGGVLVTAFPGASQSDNFVKGHERLPSYGYASHRGQLWIRNLSEVVAPSALKVDLSVFPGPLVNEPTPVKGGAAKKKEGVMEYVKTRAEEIEKGLPYLKTAASKTRREEEGKLVLLRLLEAMIVGEGKLGGKPDVEDAIRVALANPNNSNLSSARLASSTAAMPTFQYVGTAASAPAAADASQLSYISSLIAQGTKREAAEYAAEQGLWSHALVISSAVSVELWKDMVKKFTTAELDGRSDGTGAIKASYSLIGGMDAASLEDLINAASIGEDPTKDQWREVISAVLFNAKPNELACLDELGSKFLGLGLTNAANACFLLSPLSPFLDTSPAALDRGLMFANERDEDTIIFAEIAEYARSLVSLPRGQEQICTGLPQLLPYKLARAWRLAELGETESAKRYCTAIEAGTKPLIKGAPAQSLLSPAFRASLEDLLERLTGTPSVNPAKVLAGGKRGKQPGIDKIGSWIEGRLSKFIAGEEGEETAPKPPTAGGKSSGPFAHFSAVSPDLSGSVTRNTSMADVPSHNATNGYLGVQPASRATSPASHAVDNPQSQSYPSQSPYGVPQTLSRTSSPLATPNANTYSSANNPSYGGPYSRQSQPPHDKSSTAWDASPENLELESETPRAYEVPQKYEEDDLYNPMAQHSSGTDSYTPPTSGPSKQQAFSDLNDDDEDLGFGNSSLSKGRAVKPEADSKKAGAATQQEEPKQEKKRKPSFDSTAEHPQTTSWLGKLWGKKEGGPIRAKLGEESTMEFDKASGRWVVKGTQAPASAPSATPPPPRAQTASPSRAATRPDASRAMSATPPMPTNPYATLPRGAQAPPSSGSSAFAEAPDGGIKRMKSSLPMAPPSSGPPSGLPSRPPSGPPSSVPPSRPSTASSSLDDLLSGGPRPASKRPGSALKKGARNRYVDVFQGAQ
ncbi:hypothetical protein I350_03616 [Cryptococcus amylolentus CBS 6273]|uniref:Protein transport protein sec16 n=1 Tax=Cryptococcus amylolentus CBS 6273 TaxID=1296118 RepID=A0A1E3K5B4_9TREE|nr:hypothetical protein I350_03616 [Cryptococcus amylolentus CBS 6273]